MIANQATKTTANPMGGPATRRGQSMMELALVLPLLCTILLALMEFGWFFYYLATINNAAATIALRAEGGLVDFIWSFQPKETPMPKTVAEVPTISDESIALSEALRKKGFSFVGPTTMYALMEAVGMIDTHLVGSHRRGCSGVWPRE